MANGAKLAYVRVSTEEQNEARQVEALKQYDIDKWFIEKVSGKDMNRPKLREMLDYAREGDTIYIHDFSRISRSVADLMTLTKDLQERGIHLKSNKEGFDTMTPMGRAMIGFIAIINQFERENMLERQREGIEIAKREGKYKGRKPIDVNREQMAAVCERWRAGKITARAAMKELGLKSNTFYRKVKEAGL